MFFKYYQVSTKKKKTMWNIFLQTFTYVGHLQNILIL